MERIKANTQAVNSALDGDVNFRRAVAGKIASSGFVEYDPYPAFNNVIDLGLNIGDVRPTDCVESYPDNCVICLAGGGMDAFYALMSYIRRFNPKRVILLHFDYGQMSCEAERHIVEKQAIALREHFDIAVSAMFLTDSFKPMLEDHPLCDESVQARAHAGDKTVMDEKLYIPNRNARFMTQAFGIAELYEARCVVFGAVGNVNMDNSLEFIQRMVHTQEVSGDYSVGIYAPFVMYSKSAVPLYAQGVPHFGIECMPDVTVSCFFPKINKTLEVEHCGSCGSCRTMKQGFKFACIEDPYLYIAHKAEEV